MADAVDPLRAYTEARRDYEAIRTETVRKLTPMYRVAMLLRSHPHALLSAHFNLFLPTESKPDPRDLRFDINDWPDLATLRARLEGVHAAYVKMHDAWSRLSQPDQLALAGSSPPQGLSLT